jgi:hypothetical protein
VAEKKRTSAEIVSEMTEIIVGHLEAMPVEERKERVKAFKEVITHDEKHGCARPKAASSSRTERYSRRIPA